MSLETDLLTRMFQDELSMARRLVAFGDFTLAADSLTSALETLDKLRAISPTLPPTVSAPIDVASIVNPQS